MAPKLIKWFQSKLSKTSETPKSAPELPLLPHPRPLTLTPVVSRETLVETSSANFAESLFFGKLPYELRRIILVYAFGDRLVHMDLLFRHPIVWHSPTLYYGYRCGNSPVYYEHSANGLRLGLDYEKPQSWQWASSVCHRVPPGPIRGAMGYLLGPPGPWDDRCSSGLGLYCKEWLGNDPFKCCIGVMGWLLTCRRAYVEGISVLYGTNTIQMSSEAMISVLPQLVLPQRLANITSLEVVWQLQTTGISEVESSVRPKDNHLDILLALLTSNFPNLRRLFLSLQSEIHLGGINARTSIFDPIGEAIRQLPDLHQCSIALPLSVFREFLTIVLEIVGTVRQIRQHGYVPHSQIWHALDGGYAVVEEFGSPYPNAPKLLEDGNAVDKSGYWILMGKED